MRTGKSLVSPHFIDRKSLGNYLTSHPDLEGKIDVLLQQGDGIFIRVDSFSLFSDAALTGNFEVIILQTNQLIYSKKQRRQVGESILFPFILRVSHLSFLHQGFCQSDSERETVVAEISEFVESL